MAYTSGILNEFTTDFEMQLDSATTDVNWQEEWNLDSQQGLMNSNNDIHGMDKIHEFNGNNFDSIVWNSELDAYVSVTNVEESVPLGEGKQPDDPNMSLVATEQPLSPRPTGDRQIELVEVYDAMPESFKLPGDTKIYAVNIEPNIEPKLPSVKGIKNRSDVIICKCTPAEGLKMYFERALKILGLDQQFEVPTVQAEQQVMLPCRFSSEAEDKRIIGVIKSIHDKVAIFPVEGRIKFSLSQRLSGWVIGQSPRENGVLDMTYQHRGATRKFRSKIEESKRRKLMPPGTGGVGFL